jgi:hypothetical protein
VMDDATHVMGLIAAGLMAADLPEHGPLEHYAKAARELYVAALNLPPITAEEIRGPRG